MRFGAVLEILSLVLILSKYILSLLLFLLVPGFGTSILASGPAFALLPSCFPILSLRLRRRPLPPLGPRRFAALACFCFLLSLCVRLQTDWLGSPLVTISFVCFYVCRGLFPWVMKTENSAFA